MWQCVVERDCHLVANYVDKPNNICYILNNKLSLCLSVMRLSESWSDYLEEQHAKEQPNAFETLPVKPDWFAHIFLERVSSSLCVKVLMLL